MVLGPAIRKLLPYINFVVASTALGFQYFVLYPWHLELDEDFQKMKDEQHVALEEYHQKKLKRLEEIEQNIFKLESRQKVAAVQQKRIEDRQLQS